jgi:hypothetical protein
MENTPAADLRAPARQKEKASKQSLIIKGLDED